MTLVNNICLMTIAVVTLAGIYMILQYRGLLKLPEGTAEMSNLAARIRSGSKVFTKKIFSIILIVAAVLALVITFAIEHFAGIAFIVGVLLVTVAVLVGMSVATYTNVRATAAAKAAVEDPDLRSHALQDGNTQDHFGREHRRKSQRPGDRLLRQIRGKGRDMVSRCAAGV